jgi:hypothetical protein
MVANSEIVKRAEALAERNGGSWDEYIEAAHNEARQPKLEKLVCKTSAREEAQKKAAAVAELRHQQPGVGDPDPDRRVEIGECETQLGRVRVAISRDALAIHGVHTPLEDIDKDLRDAVFAAAASFNAAITDLEQAQQRTIIGALMDAVMRRHQFLSASVRRAKENERYGV